MSDYKLYCFAQSGNAYKAALFLALAGADWEPVFVDFFNGATRSPEYRALNPMGEVPILIHGEETLSQSGVILHYLADIEQQFGGRDKRHEREILRWVLFDNHKLTSYIATLRYLRRFTDQGESPVTEFLEARAIAALKVLDGQLEQGEFVTGDAMTIADLSLCGYLYFTDELGFSLEPYENVNRWLDAIRAMPGWSDPYTLMPDESPEA